MKYAVTSTLLASGLLCLLISVSGQELLAADGEHHNASSSKRKVVDAAHDVVSPAHSLANITGTYKGSWRRLEYESEQQSLQILSRVTGALFYRLSAIPTATAGVHEVEGEMIVRDGEFHTEDDVTLHLSGVYVVGSRRLHAVLESAPEGLQHDLQQADFQEQNPAYRQALRDLAHEWAGAADDPGDMPRYALSSSGNLPLQKECEFVLDFGVSQQLEEGDPLQPHQRTLLEVEAPASTLQPSSGEAPIVMNGTLHSQACGFALELNATSTKLDVYYAKAINYTLMITSLSFLQIMLLLRQMEATGTQSLMSKVSLLTIGQQAIMDAYLCLLHLTTGIMVDPLFNAFATAAFFEFVIFAIFEMRYLLSIWRARRSSSMDPWAQQRELSILYARFYSALLGGIFISYQLQRWMHILVFGVFSFWVPQIVLCAYQDARQPLKAYYAIGMSLTRMALPLYLYGCPQNLLRNPTSVTLCLLLSLYMTLQVSLVLGQSWLGSRFFIPKRLLPPKYDYFREATLRQLKGCASTSEIPDQPGDIETGDAGVECVICMNPVDAVSAPSRMITPCNHFFHPACLQRWMDVKMECPTCRTPLPQT